ncbi:MAG: hypothetical protein O9341_01605, partial [Paucibacter sp.]|nr:hypothetical protein [Roseateles sp.]
RDADGRLRVEVGDDGVGLAQRPDWKDSRTLGFQLVPLLAEQLDGQLSLLDGPGTRIRVCFASQQELPGDSSAGVATSPLSPATHALPHSTNQVPPA